MINCKVKEEIGSVAPHPQIKMKLGSVVAAAAAAAAVGAGLLGPGGASAFILSPPLRKPFVASLRPLRSAAGELADIPEQQENDIFVFREFGTSKYIEVSGILQN